MVDPPEADRSVERELIRATAVLVARGGVASVTLAGVERESGAPSGTVVRHFDGLAALLLATVDDLASDPSVAAPDLDTTPSSTNAVLAAIGRQFRGYVEDDQTRFAALLQFAAAAVFGERRYRAPTTDQHERTREHVSEHLAALHRAGLTGVATANLDPIAGFFADAARGIEMCHLLDRDAGARDAAYADLVDTAAARLANAPRQSGPKGSEQGRMTAEADYRVRMVLEPSGVIRDLLLMDGIGGWDARDLVGKPVGLAVAEGRDDPTRIAIWEERLAEARRRPGVVQFHERRTGTDPTVPPSVTATLTPIRSRDGTLESIIADVEDRSGKASKEVERFALEEQLRNALELTRLGTYVMWLREPRIIANARFAEIYGRDPQELMDTGGVDAFLRFIHAADRDHVRTALEAAMTGEVDYVANFRFWMDTPDGPELRWISGLGRVELDDEGPFRVLGVIEDVTQRHKQQEAILRSQKRDAIGTLAAGVAHDFNNVLGAILGNATAAELEVASGESPAGSLREIGRGARRAGDLVERLLSFSRGDTTRQERYAVGEVVREACALIRPTLALGVELRESIAPAVPSALGDPTGLHQVILNLVVNADHAIGDRGGLIEVEVDPFRIGDDDAVHDLPPGQHVRIRVRDDGPGIPRNVADRAFDPFFTTKPSRHSAGLGLAAAQAIVHGHGGTIAFETAPGHGTVFTVYLPGEMLPPPPKPVGSPAAPLRGAARPRVLFVDDERALTALAAREMSAAGCEAVTANDPTAALELFRRAPNSFDAVVTDLAMPQMNGLQLADRVLALRPGIPLVLTSGFISPEAQFEADRLGVGRVVRKPCTIADLASAVLELVDRPPPRATARR